MEQHAIVAQSDVGQRLDTFLARMTGRSRAQMQRAMEDGGVQVNGRRETKPSYRLREGDVVDVALAEPQPLTLKPLDLGLEILFEDPHLVVINKAAGVVVHPGPGHGQDTLVNALLFHVRDLSGIGGYLRPGIVHRLDRDTSGVLVVAKDDQAHAGLTRQFAEHSIERLYIALVGQVHGPGLQAAGTIETQYGRHPTQRTRFTGRAFGKRRAVTHYRVTDHFAHTALRVECRLETGRTHQIRVHLAEVGCPVIGDRVYGGRAMRDVTIIQRQALHARVLGFEHPVTGQRLRFEGEYPDDFRRAEEILRAGGDWR